MYTEPPQNQLVRLHWECCCCRTLSLWPSRLHKNRWQYHFRGNRPVGGWEWCFKIGNSIGAMLRGGKEKNLQKWTTRITRTRYDEQIALCFLFFEKVKIYFLLYAFTMNKKWSNNILIIVDRRCNLPCRGRYWLTTSMSTLEL